MKPVHDIESNWTEQDYQVFTEALVNAVKTGACTVLKGHDLFRTDRPANIGHPAHTGVQGNSEGESTRPFDMMAVAKAANIDQPRISLNSLRLFGNMHASAPLHVHGYSAGEKPAGQGECVIFSIKSISPYDASTGQIDHRHMARNVHLMDDAIKKKIVPGEDSPLVMLTVQDGKVKRLPLHVGDVVVLPSGAYHEFSCQQGIYADISSIEMADRATGLGRAHWGEDSFYDQVIGKTIEAETGHAPAKKGLRLADIPSLKAFIETAEPRHDAAVRGH